MSNRSAKEILIYICGGVLVLVGIYHLIENNLVVSLSFLLSGLLAIPQTFSFINKTIDYKINNLFVRLAFILLLFFLGVSTVPKTQYVPTTPSTPAKTQKVEKTEEEQEEVKGTQTEEEIINEIVGETGEETGIVVSIADGDTLRVNVNGTEMNIRLIGIDTPEINHPTEPLQCYGPEAKTALENLVLNQQVILEKDVSDKDQYDRFLRYIWLGETLVNEYMTQYGFAFSSEYPPDTKYQDLIAAAEAAARSAGEGLWAANTCNGDVYTGTYKDPNKVVTPPPPPPIDTKPDIPPPRYTDSSTYACSCSKTCGQMSSCEEAYYQLNTCGCIARDGDKDGVPCESICR